MSDRVGNLENHFSCDKAYYYVFLFITCVLITAKVCQKHCAENVSDNTHTFQKPAKSVSDKNIWVTLLSSETASQLQQCAIATMRKEVKNVTKKEQ